MLEINLIVNDQEIELAEPVTIVSGSENVYLCKFTFTAEWAGFEKTAVFQSRTDAREVYIYNNECIIPWEVLEIDEIRRQELKIGVYGVKDDARMPTVYTPPITVHDGAETAEGGGAPTPTQWEEILELLSEGTVYIDPTLTVSGKGADAKKVGDRAMLTSNVTIDSGNYQSYSDANNFAPNRIYGISIGITENMVANLPVYSVRGFLAYFAHYEGYPNGFQIHVSSQGLWYRNWTGTDTWNAWKKCLIASDIDTTLAVTGAPADAKAVGDRALLTSNVTIDGSNYQNYPDANNFTPNRTYGIGIGITENMIANLPRYSTRGFLTYFGYYEGFSNGYQIYSCAYGTWIRCWISSTSWSEWEKVADQTNALTSSNVTISSLNYTDYDADNLPANGIYGISATITSEMLPNLPEYGETSFLLQFNYLKGSNNNVQIYVNKYRMFWRAKYSLAWSDWNKVQEDFVLYPCHTMVTPEARVDRWAGHDVLLFGDSITVGSHVSRTWFSYVADAYSCTSHNYAKSGAGFIVPDPDETRLNIMTQVNKVTAAHWAASELIIVAAGTNDAAQAGLTASGFRTAVQDVITAIRTHSQKPIIFITPLHRHFQSSREQLTPYISGAICNLAIENRCSVINGYDFPISMKANDWIDDLSDEDGLHPNEDGNWAFAQCFMQATK